MSITKRDNPLRILLEGSSLKLIFIAAIYFFSLRLAPAAFAARSISITANKTALTADEELTLTASPSGFTAGETIYIKGAFYKEGSTNYFGYTKKDNNWIKNSATTTDQRSIIIGSWDNTTIVKPDYSDSGFQGNGNYLLKLGYYYITGGGNLSSVQWSTNNVTVSLTQPTPTPTPSPTPTLTPTPTPKPSATPTITPTNTSIPAPTPSPVLQAADDNLSPKVLAGTDENPQPEVNLDIIDMTAATASETNPSPTPPTKQNRLTSPVFIISASGAALMLAGGIPLFWLEFKSKKGIIFK